MTLGFHVDSRLVVTYPPEHDGELFINVENKEGAFSFMFTHAQEPGDSAWDTLVEAAKAILAQEGRRKQSDPELIGALERLDAFYGKLSDEQAVS